MGAMRSCLAAAALAWLAWPGGEAAASCYPVARAPGGIVPAAFSAAAVKPNHVRIEFVGHSTFVVESPRGVRVATDYNDYIRPPVPPTVVTMNNAHDTHYSHAVEEGVLHVLRGWDPAGGIARHNVSVKDVRVRNVPTNLAEFAGRWRNGNSMFVIESQGLCIVHISHLHHVLSDDQMRDLGRIDIAFAPIDGMWTMSHQELFEVLGRIKPMLVIPMHYGSMGGVQAFIARARAMWPVREHDSASIELSFRDLPRKTEVLFLQGR